VTVPVIKHEDAEAVGVLLSARLAISTPYPDNTMGWADVVQFVLLKAREIAAARADHSGTSS
jgi:hypothetical protein